MTDFKTLIKTKRLYFDGGFGTLLQELGLEKGVAPESWNITHPQKVTQIHKSYIDVGSNIITTNTFGVNSKKYDNYEELITCAIDCAKDAKGDNDNVFIALDLGPTGKMLEPLGDLPFEDAVELYANNVKVAVKNGVDLVIIETMNDCYETKAAVLAVKENSDLPVFVTNVYDKTGKLMTGANPLAMIAMLEGLGVDAIGMNCSFGPDIMLNIIDEFTQNCSLPLIANPNAGLPQVVNGETIYNINADDFSDYMVQLAEKGVNILGGCCGTTPEYIKKTIEKTKDIPVFPVKDKNLTLVSSYTHAVKIDAQPILIGERINPTGKKKLKEALKNNDLNYILNEGILQSEKGVHILDVNVGLPEIDEVKMMSETVFSLQSVVNTPIQIDSSNPKVLQKAMRIYNGKPLINSVNGEEESMNSIFPLVKKYGGTVIALTMDKSGIPTTASERVKIAEKIIDYAKKFGIAKKDIIVDPLCLTVSSDTKSALVTLESVKMLNQKGIKTSLGVSNISFGLPERQKINTSFFNSALENGLNCAIMNPFSSDMMDVYFAFRVLHNQDASCTDYIEYVSNSQQPLKPQETVKQDISLKNAIIKGLKESAVEATVSLLNEINPLDIINEHIVPALSEVGISFENKKTFLPQLLMSAESASSAFEKIKEKMPQDSINENKSVILATVKGDIHDIGKNIVKVLLESYGFKVYDLGKDVEPQTICDCVKNTGCKLVGLSALMTTTVTSMEETIKLLHQNFTDVKVMVGGAVLTEDYAKMINADCYCADATNTVAYTQEFYKN